MDLFALADLERGAGRALLDATVALGFSPEVARAGLEAELDAWAEPGAVDRALAELPDDLDPARRPRCVLVIAARTLPASALRAVLMARLLGARVLLKPAAGQAALAHAVAEADPLVEPVVFASDDQASLARHVRRADTVVVLGSDEALREVRPRVPPDRTFVGYGHRLSVAWLEETSDEALDGLANDLCAWDQAGCLSPQVAWTREPPEELLRRLAVAVERVERRLPMRLPPDAARPRHVAETLARMRGRAATTDTALLLALPEARFRASPGWRTLWLLPADPGALKAVAPQLSTIGYSGPEPLRPACEGVRVCALGRMQRPPLDWLHDGRPNLSVMLRDPGR